MFILFLNSHFNLCLVYDISVDLKRIIVSRNCLNIVFTRESWLAHQVILDNHCSIQLFVLYFSLWNWWWINIVILLVGFVQNCVNIKILQTHTLLVLNIWAHNLISFIDLEIRFTVNTASIVTNIKFSLVNFHGLVNLHVRHFILDVLIIL